MSHSLQGSFVSDMAIQYLADLRPMNEDVSTLQLFRAIIVTGIPLGLAALAQFSIGAVLIVMVGTLGVEQIGGASLAFGLINATAFSLSAGFCGALETVLSHTYGRDPHSKLYGVYAQRMVIILIIVAVGLGPMMTFTDILLLKIGQEPRVVYYMGVFCRVALFGVFQAMLLELMRRYFACQHLNTPLSINLIVSAVIFPFLLAALVRTFGFIGAPIGWVILMTMMSGTLLVYLRVTGKYKQTWAGWDDSALHNWGPLLRLALPSVGMMMSEWMSLEINALAAGFGDPHSLAAFSIVYQISGVLWSHASGVFIAAAVLVGNAIGEGKNKLAKRTALCCMAITIGYASMHIILLISFRDFVPYIFTRDEEAVRIFHTLLKFFVVYHFFDCVQSCMMGILRGCGKQFVGAIAVGIVFSVVGVPLGITVFFTTDLGIAALWMGPCIGVSCVGGPIYCYILFRHIKWDELEAQKEELPSSLEDECSTFAGTFNEFGHGLIRETDHNLNDDEGFSISGFPLSPGTSQTLGNASATQNIGLASDHPKGILKHSVNDPTLPNDEMASPDSRNNVSPIQQGDSLGENTSLPPVGYVDQEILNCSLTITKDPPTVIRAPETLPNEPNQTSPSNSALDGTSASNNIASQSQNVGNTSSKGVHFDETAELSKGTNSTNLHRRSHHPHS